MKTNRTLLKTRITRYKRLLKTRYIGKHLKSFFQDLYLYTVYLIEMLCGSEILIVPILDNFIGHLIVSTCVLTCKRSQLHKTKVWFLLSGSKVSNRLLFDYIDELSSRNFCLGIFGRRFLFKEAISRGIAFHNAGDIQELTPEMMQLNKSKLLDLRSELITRAKAGLTQDLVDKVLGNKIAVVQIRCNRHHSIRSSWASRISLDLRNAPADLFREGIMRLIDQGYTVIRTGLFLSEKLVIPSSQYIEIADYKEDVGEFLTVLSMLKAQLILSTGSGPDCLAALNPSCFLGLVFQAHYHSGIPAWKQVFYFPSIRSNAVRLSPFDVLSRSPLLTDADLESQSLRIVKSKEDVNAIVSCLLRLLREENDTNDCCSAAGSLILEKMYNSGNLFALHDWMKICPESVGE